ncbi:SPOR domain-containing protein [Hydrogenophaga sp. 2FB]|uniref:SPOR domain-containing protein n=1 Tax=Hydrogenophaga sp. 2FB TaxID=2502187 RepID=UPI0010F49E39|nr:SPOR domain-containing protein [Hydrogenophaga sp. 2FB]
MFKSRSGSQGNASTPPPQSIEAVRRRARHRLIGASVLVLVGVVGFPLLFDTQPRPISVDIPIEIPAKTAPVAKPAAAAAPAPVAAAPAAAKPAAAEPLSSRDGLSAREEVVEKTPKPAAPVAAATPAPTTPEPAKPAAPAAPTDAARARALLEGKPTPTAQATAKPASAAAERLVVQVGAFSEAAGARQVRQKLEGAGLKTYTHEAKTADGTRIRVRVGPFDNRADADKAAARVKAMGLPAAVLTL